MSRYGDQLRLCSKCLSVCQPEQFLVNKHGSSGHSRVNDDYKAYALMQYAVHT